jgi:hypothetical protein
MKIGDMWADSGCVRGVGGNKEHAKYRQFLAENFHLKPIEAPCSDHFQFGDGVVKQAVKKYYYPVFLKNIFRGALDQARVDVDCPQLLSKGIMKKWSVDLCFGPGETRIHKFKVNVPFTSDDVPMVNIFDMDVQSVIDQWDKIPKHFKVFPHPPKVLPKRRTTIWKKGKPLVLESTLQGPQVVNQPINCVEPTAEPVDPVTTKKDQ